MKRINLLIQLLIGVFAFSFMTLAQAGGPLWTFTQVAGYPPSVTVSKTGSATVKYTVTNQSKKAHTLVMKPLAGVSQTEPCKLAPKGSALSSCTLTLSITGSALPPLGISEGPFLCQANRNGTPNPNLCYQPSSTNVLNISVVAQPSLVSIAITPTNPSIAKGTTQKFTAIGTYSDSSTKDLTSSVTWSSSNTEIATISNQSGSQGLAIGKAVGATTIKAELDSVSGSTSLTVTNATLVSIAITPPNPQIAKGTTQQFIAIGTYSDFSTQNLTDTVTWSSSNNAIATISNTLGSKGLATGEAPGTTTITAALSGVTGTTSLTVTNATLVSIAIVPQNRQIANGTSQRFIAIGTFSDSTTHNITSLVTWSSSDSSVATISNTLGTKGRATGKSAGTTTISATLSGVTGTASLTVTNATLVSIAVTPVNSQIAKGLTQQFTAIGTYSDDSTQDITNAVTWTSSNTAIATISNAPESNGLATGEASGTTTITATLGSVANSTSLAVTNATLVSIAVTPDNSQIAKGTTQQFTAIGTYSDSSTYNITSAVTWVSSNTATATISNAPGSNGLATGGASGTTTITAILGFVAGTASLEVTDATLVSIAVTPVNSQIAKGLTQQFTAIGTYSDASTQDLTSSVSWSSSSIATATISNVSGSNGLAIGESAGTTTITATLGSVSGTASLAVTNATLVSITVSPTNPSIAKGTTQQFTAMGTYSDSSTYNITSAVTWISSNTATATISNASESNGLATGEASGSTTITAVLGSVSGATSLAVTNATLVSIAVTPVNSQIAKGLTQQFTAIGTFSDASTQDLTSSVSWSSSSIATATISNASGSNGLATGESAGTATITATLGSVSGTASLAVTNATLVSITVSPTNPSIAKGTTQQFTAMGTYSDSSTHNITSAVTWISSNTATATISNASESNGLATGEASGSTTITAVLGSVSGATSLAVTDATLVSIAVTPANPQIAKGTTQQFTAIGTFSDASTQDLTSSVSWSSSSIATATISNTSGSNGLATGEASGTTTITAALSGVTGSTSLAVTNATLVSITVSPTNPSIAKGTTQQFTAMGTYSDSSTQNITSLVTWSSSNTATATISNASESNGLATGEASGSTTITAALGGISGTTSLAVTNATLVSIVVTPVNSQIAKGLTQQFTAIGTFSDASTQDLTSSVSWSSSSIATATISNVSGSNGLATGESAGTATITATLGSVSGTASLAVTNATLVSIAVSPTNPSIAKGTTQQFTAMGTYSDSSTYNITSAVTWTSSNTATATISNALESNGLATGEASGSTTITAVLGSVSGATSLAVTNATLISIAVTPANPQIAKGTTQQFTAIGTFSDASTQDLTSSVSWSSSSIATATISNASGSNGLATGESAGTTTITATLGSVSGTASLAVTNATLVSIAVSPTNPSIAKGTTQQFTAIGTYSDSSTHNITSAVTWISSNTATATISNASESNGLATGEASGSTTITAVLGSVSGSTSLAVTNATLVSIAVTPVNSQIAKGLTQQFTAIGTFSDASTQDLTSSVSWSSSSIATATISNASGSNGLATGESAGTTTITATLGSVSGTASLAVTNATLVSIAVSPTNPSIAKGTTQQFTAIGTYSDSSTHNITSAVTWISSNTATATISNASESNGLATGEASGSTTITAVLGSASGATSLAVTNATLVSIEVTPANSQIAKGTTQQFTAIGTFSDASTQDLTSSVSWSSSSIATATISNVSGSNGFATGVASGTTTITAALSGVTGSTSLAVTNATLVSIAVSPTNPSIAKGTTQQFTAMGTYSDSSTQNITSLVTWSSSNTATATISNATGSNGLATGESAGATTITAALDGVLGTTDISVTSATLVSIEVTPANSQIAKGTTQQFTAIGTFSDASTQDLTSSVSWSSSSIATATISNVSGSNGFATGVASGTTTITAALSGVTGSTSLAVTNATLVSIAVSPTNPSIAKGTTQQFTAMGTYSDSSTQNITSLVTWSSSNTATATISNAPGSNGLATGNAASTTTITATLEGVLGTTSLSVTDATLVSIAVTPISSQIAKGLTQQFTAIGTFSDASTQDLTSSVTWSSSSITTATISNVLGSNGLATGEASGTTTITATLGSVSGTASLAVTNATLVSIAVTPTNPSIAKGTTQQFTAMGTYSDSSTHNITSAVTWTSSSTATATISNAPESNGLATGESFGTTTITATLGGISGTASLAVTNATLVSIAVTPISSQIAKGITQQFTAIGTYSDSSIQDLTSSVTWSSSSIATATISNESGSNGLATGVSSGTTTIAATLDSVSGTASLAVTNATLVSIAVTPTDPSIAKGTTQQFTAIGTFSDSSTHDLTSSVTWSSSNTAIATISNTSGSNGIATGVASGTTTITATLSSVSGTSNLAVTNATLVSIAITPPNSQIAKGLTQQFTATGTYSDSSTQDLTSSVTWSSSITNIATISNAPQTNGLATGNSPGTTTITASLGSVSTTTSLTVTNATLVSIAVTPTNPSIAEGTTQQLTAMGTFSDSNVYNVTSSVIWSSSDTTIATVSNAPESNGQATGLSSGTATITATLGSVSGTTNLAVTNATLVSIAVTPTNQQIAKGTTQQFTAIGTYSDASTQDLTDTVTWSSSSIATATISNATGSNGLATGVSSGTTTVTAALGSVSGTASLAVTNATLVSIAVTPTNSSIAEGTSQQFTAIGTYSDSSTQNLTSSVTWASSNTATATISNAAGSNGLANGESAGATTITATLDSVSGTASLTVTNATLVSIAITPVNASIATGLTQQFTAVGTYSDSSTQDLTNSVIWSSSNTGSATISNAPGSNGRATGVSSGSTTITATLDSVSGAASLVVTNATLVSIAVTPTNPSIAKGTTQQFTAIGTFSDSSTHDLTSSVIWTSSNTAIATISNASGSNGLAAGASSGSTIITATLGSVSDTANLEVTNATLVSIAVTPPNPQIADGFTQQFTAIGTYSDSSTQDLTSTVTWSSSSTAIATVSNASGSNGQATGVSSGTATITAVLGSVSGTANLAVTNATLVSIAVTPTNPSIAKGTTQQFTATGTFSDSSTLNLTSSVTWSSSNTSTATISNAAGSNGIATGVASGTTAITAALGSVSGTTNLAVTNATLVSIEITPPNPQIAKGSTQQFTATGTYSDSSTQNLTSSVTWTSSDTAIATISNVSGSNGQATGASSGTTTITATSGSVSGSASLAVTNATLVSITVSPTNPSIAKGTTQQFTATGTYSDSSTQNLSSSVTWSSSSTAIATISNAAGSNGLATGVSSGSSVITATLGSVSGTGSITVTDATLVLITVTPSNPQIAAGLTQQFTATGTYSDFSTQILTTSVTWTSSSTATATISNASGSKGLATGASSGTTAITATLGSVSGTANLAVTNATLVSIAVMPADAQIAQGSTQQFIATGTFTDSSTLDITSSVTWSSSDTVTATISNASGSKGLATGESSGITTITATAGGSISGTTSLTVSSRISIAVGYYHDTSSVTRPLLAQSQDLGDNWIYPESITAPIFTPNNTYPYASDGLLQSANCSGALCIAGGIYIDSSGNSRPLLAQSSDLGSTWQFPESITAPVFEPNNTYPYSFLGSFIGTSCFGTSCIAAGSYTDINFINRPLLAQSQDSGVTWTYPESITAPDFKPNNTYPFNNNGSFANTSCNNNTCIAVGHYYSDASTRRALLAQSQNSGVTWTYPSSVTAPVFTPNTYPYSADGIFYSVSCTSTNSGSNYCVAVGLYSDASAVSRPLLAVSQDSGVTWTFPGSITAPFFTPSNTYPFQGDGVLFGVSCDGSICVAVGRYTDTNNIKRPLLAQSTDAGVTWTYPTSVTAPVFTPSNTYPFGNPTGSQITFLTSASCHGSICIAVGSYTDSNTIIRPLLVQSTNSGATWTYPESITAPSFPSAYAFSNFGSLIRARCDGNICIAAGIYTTGDPTRRPLLAQSTDSGVTWTYPESIPVPVFTPTNTYPFAEQGTLSGAGSNNSWAPESLSFLLD